MGGIAIVFLHQDRGFLRKYSFEEDAVDLLTGFVAEAYGDSEISALQKITNILTTDAAVLAVWTQPIKERPIRINRFLVGAAIAKSDTYVDPPDPLCSKALISGIKQPEADDIFFFTGDVHKHTSMLLHPLSMQRLLRSPHVETLIDRYEYGDRLDLEARLLYLKRRVYVSEDLSDALGLVTQ